MTCFLAFRLSVAIRESLVCSLGAVVTDLWILLSVVSLLLISMILSVLPWHLRVPSMRCAECASSGVIAVISLSVLLCVAFGVVLLRLVLTCVCGLGALGVFGQVL